MERGGTGRRFHRPCSGADSDAHTVGYPVTKGVNAHELFTPNALVCDAQQVSYATDGQTSKGCWEASRWIAVEWRGVIVSTGGGWRRMASNGGWRRLTQEGTDVQNPPGVRAELNQRTGRQFV